MEAQEAEAAQAAQLAQLSSAESDSPAAESAVPLTAALQPTGSDAAACAPAEPSLDGLEQQKAGLLQSVRAAAGSLPWQQQGDSFTTGTGLQSVQPGRGQVGRNAAKLQAAGCTHLNHASA